MIIIQIICSYNSHKPQKSIKNKAQYKNNVHAKLFSVVDRILAGDLKIICCDEKIKNHISIF